MYNCLLLQDVLKLLTLKKGGKGGIQCSLSLPYPNGFFLVFYLAMVGKIMFRYCNIFS